MLRARQFVSGSPHVGLPPASVISMRAYSATRLNLNLILFESRASQKALCPHPVA